MSNYYLDIETTGLNPIHYQIITIQYAKLDKTTGKKLEDLHILKSWEFDSEKSLIKQFMVESDIVSSDRFSFVAIGYNLSFEHKFFSHRCAANSLYPIDIITRPHIDLHPIAIMINSGDFKETTLSAFTNKKHNGTQIPIWYDQKNYSDIENYISEEFAEFSPPEKSEEKTVNINWTTVSVIGTLGGITFAAFKIFRKLKKDALE